MSYLKVLISISCDCLDVETCFDDVRIAPALGLIQVPVST